MSFKKNIHKLIYGIQEHLQIDRLLSYRDFILNMRYIYIWIYMVSFDSNNLTMKPVITNYFLDLVISIFTVTKRNPQDFLCGIMHE